MYWSDIVLHPLKTSYSEVKVKIILLMHDLNHHSFQLTSSLES